jgi:hypothetical protein
MSWREILTGSLLLSIVGFFASHTVAQNITSMAYQTEIKSLSQNIVDRAERGGCRRAEFNINSQVRYSDVNRLFTQEITDSFINAAKRLEIIDLTTWETIERNRRATADGRYNPDSGTLPRAGRTEGADCRIDIAVQEVRSDDYRVAARVTKIESGVYVATDNRIIMPPSSLRHRGRPPSMATEQWRAVPTPMPETQKLCDAGGGFSFPCK